MSLIAYGLIALAILGAIGTGVYKVRESGKESVRLEWAEANKKAAEAAAAKDEENRKAKEKADVANAKTKRDLAGLYDAYRSLRDQRRGSLLPEAAPGSASPERITFDRKGFDNALSGFDSGVTGLLKEGDSAIVDLDTAKRWAQTRWHLSLDAKSPKVTAVDLKLLFKGEPEDYDNGQSDQRP